MLQRDPHRTQEVLAPQEAGVVSSRSRPSRTPQAEQGLCNSYLSNMLGVPQVLKSSRLGSDFTET